METVMAYWAVLICIIKLLFPMHCMKLMGIMMNETSHP